MHYSKVLKLCDLFKKLDSKPADPFYAYQCMFNKVITCDIVLFGEEASYTDNVFC